MSEFQYYEFKTIDRAFTVAERAEINSWSSRAKADSHSVKFIYHYGDFRKNTEDVMLQYFDAGIYWANFGCKQLMFRFPLSAINKKELIPYTFSDNIEIRSKGDYLLLIISENIEDGGYNEYIDEEDSPLSDLMGIRQEILNGDYRALYLAWLYFHSTDNKGYFPEDYYENEDEQNEDEEIENRLLAIEPPLPPNLDLMTSADRSLCQFFGLTSRWILAAAAHSPTKTETQADFASLIAQLPEAEKNDYLLRLAQQESNLSSTFLKYLKTFCLNPPV